jgi:hypothetical protein
VLSLHCSGSITSFVAAPALGRHNFQFSGSGSDNRNGKEALFDRCIIRGEQRDATPSATGLRAAPRSYLQSHRRANREPPVKLRSVNSIPSEVRGPFHRPSTSPGSPSVFHYRSLPIGEPDCMIQGANIAHSLVASCYRDLHTDPRENKMANLPVWRMCRDLQKRLF